MDIWIQAIGWIATLGSVTMYAPQTFKTLKTKSAASLELAPFLILFVGCITWTIFCSMMLSYQGWITNFCILFLMIPIFFYIFKDNKKSFVLVVVSILITISISTFFIIWKLNISFWVKLPFSIIAGSCTGFGLLPQSIKVFREKDIKDYSLISSILVMVFNVFWTLYWIGEAYYSKSGEGVTAEQDLILKILSSFFSFSGLATQLPVLYVYLNHTKKAQFKNI